MKRGTPEHPKTAALAKALGVDLLTAVGVLECLWHFSAKYARRGDIGRFTDEAIARGIYWKGNPKRLIDALVACRWLDKDRAHRLLVHHWKDHADEAVKKALERAGEDFFSGNRNKVSRRSVPTKRPDKTAVRPAQPSPAQPEPSQSLAQPMPGPKPQPDQNGRHQSGIARGDGGRGLGAPVRKSPLRPAATPRPKAPEPDPAVTAQLLERLTAAGVEPGAATKLAARYTPDRITRVCDLVANDGDTKNPGGRIVALLRRSANGELTDGAALERKLERLRRQVPREPDARHILRRPGRA